MVYRCQDKRKGKLYACKIIDRRIVEAKRNELLQQFQVRVAVWLWLWLWFWWRNVD